MGNCCCPAQPSASAPVKLVEITPTPVEASDKKVSDADASAIVEALLEGYLPELTTQIGTQLGDGNDGGGLPIGGPYSLVLKRKDSDESPIVAEFVEELSVDVEEVTIAPGRHRDEQRGVTKLSSASEAANSSPTLVMELQTSLHLKLGSSGLDLQLGGDAGGSPNVAVEVEWITVKAKLRLTWAVREQTLSIAFLEQPYVKWDIELRLFLVGLPMPSWLEDSLPALAVAKILAHFGPDDPLVVRLGGGEPLGLRWTKLDIQPTSGEALKNEALEAALAGGKTTFTLKEFQALKLSTAVRQSSWVEAGGELYRPLAKGEKEVEQNVRFQLEPGQGDGGGVVRTISQAGGSAPKIQNA